MKTKFAKTVLCVLLIMGLVYQTAVCSFAAANSFTKTGDMAQDMVNAALAQKGKKNSDFSGMPDANWCAYFICWVANQAGAASAGLLPKSYSDCGTTGKPAYWVAKKKTGHVYVFTDKGEAKMQTNAPGGNWSKVSRSSVTPKKGDLVLFRWSGAASSVTWSHIGLVYNVDSSKIYYVDGNGVSGESWATSYVSTHSLSRTSTEIAGYIRPNYPGGTVQAPDPSSITLTATGVTIVTDTTVQINGKCSYTGTRPSEVGLYFGTSPSDLYRAYSDTISSTENPFDIKYSKSGLAAGTTYYYRLCATVNGKEVKLRRRSELQDGRSLCADNAGGDKLYAVF